MGSIVYSPLAQGLLTDKYLNGIPEGSRATFGHFLKKENITSDVVRRASVLNRLAHQRGQSLAQMAFAWVLRRPEVTSALMGASRVVQIDDAVAALSKPDFSADELREIEATLR